MAKGNPMQQLTANRLIAILIGIKLWKQLGMHHPELSRTSRPEVIIDHELAGRHNVVGIKVTVRGKNNKDNRVVAHLELAIVDDIKTVGEFTATVTVNKLECAHYHGALSDDGYANVALDLHASP